MVMKNLKTVKFLTITASIRGVEHRLTLQFQSFNGIIRAYHFCYEDCEILNAVCDETHCSFVQMRPKLMGQLLDYVHKSPEIVLIAKVNQFSVRSYQAPETLFQKELLSKAKSVINTGLSINISEFDVYEYQDEEAVEVAMIFCLKEVSSFVGYCEVLDVEKFVFYFSTGGR
jgi:hypothetical protein